MLKEHRAIFRFLGLDRLEKTINFYIGASFFFQLLLVTFLCTIQIFYCYNELEKLSNVFEILFLLIAVDVKIAISYWHGDTFHFIFNFVEEHQNKVPSNYKAFNRKVVKYFWILMGTSINSYSVKPFTILLQKTNTEDITEILIFPTWLPFGTNSVIHYGLLLWHFSIALYGGLLMTIWDTYVSTVMVFIIGQLKYIQTSVQSLSPTPDYKDKLIDLIHHHQKIIRFSRMLNAHINPVMSVYLFTCSVMICSTGFQLFKLGFSMKSFFLLEYIIALMCQLFLFYWFANEIYLESLNLHNATWNSNWYMFPKEQKQMLYILRMFWIKAEIYYVGPFNQMSIKTFLDILQASYTYLTVLKHISDKQEQLTYN